MLKIIHIDMNFKAFKLDMLKNHIRTLAKLGYNAILWEMEDKIQWETCPEVVHPDAMSKQSFRELLTLARSLGMECIPLLQTIGHGEYVLMHPEYAHFREDPKSHDCYCTSHPEVRTFFKKWIAEIFDLYDGKIKFYHMGGDEAYVFGTCQKCRTVMRSKLYGEYIASIGAEIIRRGGRPCIWGDMILQKQDELDMISKDFVICDWNYWSSFEDTAFKNTEKLLEAGFDVMLCSATESAGDDPILGRWHFHFENVVAAALFCTSHQGIVGNCVTSWSIRLGPKSLQIPLFESAIDAMNGKITKENRGEYEKDIIRRYTGSGNFDAYERLCFHFDGNKPFTAIQWDNLKDSLPAPEGHFEKQKKKFMERGDLDTIKAETETFIADASAAMQAFKENKTDYFKLFLAGAALKIRLAGVFLAVLQEQFSTQLLADAETLKADLIRWYEQEETHSSAVKNAGLVLDPTIEEIRKNLDQVK